MDDSLITPTPYPIDEAKDQESFGCWGFTDTHFGVNRHGHVEISGSRYDLCKGELPYLIPWIEGVIGVKMDVNDTKTPLPNLKIPEAKIHKEFLSALKSIFTEKQITLDPQLRFRHGHGHTQAEIYTLRYEKIRRIPDLVVFPEKETEILELVQIAKNFNICLIPYGGGTSVTEALKCRPHEDRMIVSVSMKRMNRILWIDPVNQQACIQAGAVGRHIMNQLESKGFTLGHEPDSVEFSTLGGWIATNASGMKRNRYGNIEDLVLDMHVVTAQGKIEHSPVGPRESMGLDPRKFMFGSEGNLGIITSATVKIFPLPEVKKYDSIIFPSFEDGFNFLFELKRTGTAPASIRLVDNLQFQMGLALKHAPKGFKRFKSKLENFFVTKLKKFDPQKMVACTIVYEGTQKEVEQQERQILNLAKKYRGLRGGSENGSRGYQLTFTIAYLRDFIMNYYILAESFETSVPWSKALALCENVKKRIYEEHAKRHLPGKPFITCRVTQLYQTGVCVYFYFAYYFKGVENPSQVYSEIEALARREILANGGTLSHHHGVGKLREEFLPDINSPALLDFNQQTKRAVDPFNLFGSNNQSLVQISKNGPVQK